MAWSFFSFQRFRFPFLPSAPSWPDLLAGISAAGLLLPQALAYSGIGNLPAKAGIIALAVGLLCYGLLGSNRFALVSPTSSSAIVLAAATASITAGNPARQIALASGLVIAGGVIFLIAAFARLGSITDFIARPVLRGFTFGLAIIIIIRQMSIIVGVDSGYDNLFYFMMDLANQFHRWNIACIIISALTLFCLFVLGKYRHLPSGIIVIAAGILAGIWIDFSAMSVPLIGSIHIGMTQIQFPSLSLREWLELFELALAMVFMLYAESYGSIRSTAMKHGDPTSPNRDLFALGVANFVSGLFQGMPVGAGYSATAANEAGGAKTRFSGLFALLVTLAVLATALPYIERIPQPVLAGIVVYTMLITLNPSDFAIYFAWKNDRLIAVASVLAVLFLGVLQGLLAAVAISLVIMLRQISASTLSRLGRLGQSHDFVSLTAFPEARSVPGILILRPEQGLFFANAERVLQQARQILASENERVNTVILSLELTDDLDTTSIEALRDFFLFVETRQKKLALARLKDPVYDMLNRSLAKTFPNIPMSQLSVERTVGLAQNP